MFYADESEKPQCNFATSEYRSDTAENDPPVHDRVCALVVNVKRIHSPVHIVCCLLFLNYKTDEMYTQTVNC